jgi:hypothetical protein
MARDLGELLKRGGHAPSEYGVWQVHGEDPNCDLGGAHSNPLLGYFQGTFEDVCKHALTLQGFFQWGAGGYVIKANNGVKSATRIGNGGIQKHREEAIDNLLHDAKEFVKEKLGKDYEDSDTVEIKFCDLVKMLKDYEKDGSETDS